MIRLFGITALLTALALGLSGCGVRGPLEPPPGAIAQPDVKAPSTEPVDKSRPQKPFVLDGLL
jgi:predicted small lipoprotein YifL